MIAPKPATLTFRAYAGIYLRERDYWVFAFTLVGNGIISYLILSSSLNAKSASYCLLAAGVTLGLIALSVIIDADLRSRTSYSASRDGLDIQRDGRTIKSVSAKHLLSLEPKWVDAKGFGSADLPASDGAAYTFQTNGFEIYIPSLNAKRSIEVVPDILGICGILRYYAYQADHKVPPNRESIGHN